VAEPHFGPFTYWNRAGLTNVNPDMPVPQKDCVWPTNHMVIKHDGDVLLCCCDWEYKVVHGNVFTDRIEEVWTNASFQHYRDTLKQGRRDKLRMCRKCNKGSFNNEADRIENLKVWMEKKSIGESVSETI
jgi:radical SAM protein with 4Fe4S-binding SPASM domain